MLGSVVVWHGACAAATADVAPPTHACVGCVHNAVTCVAACTAYATVFSAACVRLTRKALCARLRGSNYSIVLLVEGVLLWHACNGVQVVCVWLMGVGAAACEMGVASGTEK